MQIFTFLQAADKDKLNLKYKLLSCEPKNYCHTILNFNETTGEIKLRKLGLDETDLRFNLTVQVCLKCMKNDLLKYLENKFISNTYKNIIFRFLMESTVLKQLTLKQFIKNQNYF